MVMLIGDTQADRLGNFHIFVLLFEMEIRQESKFVNSFEKSSNISLGALSKVFFLF